MEEWMYRSTFFYHGIRLRWVVSFKTRAFYPPYPMDRGLGGSQSRSRRHGELKNVGPTGTRTRTFRSSSQSLYRLCYPGFSNNWKLKRKLNFRDFAETNALIKSMDSVFVLWRAPGNRPICYPLNTGPSALCNFTNKQRIFFYAALSGWSLLRRCVFCEVRTGYYIFFRL
jgi:hypothetical protein